MGGRREKYAPDQADLFQGRKQKGATVKTSGRSKASQKPQSNEKSM